VWYEIASGELAPEPTQHYLQHATNCEYCGNLLGEAVSDLSDETTVAEAKEIAALESARPKVATPPRAADHRDTHTRFGFCPMVVEAEAPPFRASSGRFGSGSDRSAATSAADSRKVARPRL